MNRTLLAIAAAIIVCSAAMPADAAKKAKAKPKPPAIPCTSAANLEALNVRALQTELMVGALACGERERYNAFVQARQPELVPYAQNSPAYAGQAYKRLCHPGRQRGLPQSPTADHIRAVRRGTGTRQQLILDRRQGRSGLQARLPALRAHGRRQEMSRT